MQLTEQDTALIDAIKAVLYPWRKFTIAVDGRDGAGKSTLARLLAWQLGMPAIETDLLLLPDTGVPAHDQAMLRYLVNARHERDRPVIVEGVFVLRTLEGVAVAPDFIIYVELPQHEGSLGWQREFAAYEAAHLPKQRANFLYTIPRRP